MSGYMGKIADQARRLISADPYFLSTFFLLITINPVISSIMKGDWVELFFLVGIYYSFAVIAACLFTFLGRTGNLLKYVSLVIGYAYLVITLFCRIRFRAEFDTNVLETMLSTNIHEVSEFISTFVSWLDAVLIILPLAALLGGQYLCRNRWKITSGEKLTDISLYLFVYYAIVLIICHKKAYSEFEEVGQWTIPFENVAIDLKEHEPNSVALTETSSEHVEKVVLIIGESHAKRHSSLYGYNKNTNPELGRLLNDSSICLYSKVHAPAIATTEAFKFILNTRQIKDHKKEWYKFPSIITIMRSAGYNTSWLSNQEEVGLYDNMASCFAHICDSYTFNQKEERLDGNLLKLHKIRQGKELIIYHLMGQHVDFSKRYPAEFDRFKSDDYKGVRCNDKKILAQYDNACLYNDHVVASIMNEYRNYDAIVIYFPDHGLDVYESSPNYFGHAALNCKSHRAGYNIPFLVYTSDLFNRKHPTLHEKINADKDKEFSTANVTFMVMNIAGYDLK